MELKCNEDAEKQSLTTDLLPVCHIPVCVYFAVHGGTFLEHSPVQVLILTPLEHHLHTQTMLLCV